MIKITAHIYSIDYATAKKKHTEFDWPTHSGFKKSGTEIRIPCPLVFAYNVYFVKF